MLRTVELGIFSRRPAFVSGGGRKSPVFRGSAFDLDQRQIRARAVSTICNMTGGSDENPRCDGFSRDHRQAIHVGPGAAETLVKHRISAVPVIDDRGNLVGIVSEGDLLHRAEARTERRHSWWLTGLIGGETLASEYIKAHSRKVADVMTKRVITAAPDVAARSCRVAGKEFDQTSTHRREWPDRRYRQQSQSCSGTGQQPHRIYSSLRHHNS